MSKKHRGEPGESARLRPPKIMAIVLSLFLAVSLCPSALPLNVPISPGQAAGSSPRVVITKVKLLGIHRLARTDSDVRRVIENPKNVKITWKETFMIVEFELQGSNDPGNNEYAFRLVERDEDWIQIGNKNSIIVENLRPGKHVLRVKGANSEGIWDNEGASLNIQVVPAWWKTSLFYLVLIIVLSSAFFVLFWQIRKRYKSGLQEQIDTARIASEFFLTPREAEILELILKGKSIKDMSQELYISESTVQKHIYSVYKKMNIRNRIQLLHFARGFRPK